MKIQYLRGASIAVLAATSAFGGAARAQEAAEVTEVVVTGFRSSLDKALAVKREATGVVDTIIAEDIAKFPDANLAESMQRVPGVALQRGDGGEGRAITVRGLGPIFTRTRVNGMEANSVVGGTDVQGASGRGRGFDFNVFASEVFQNLTVRKTYSADVQEGSLGATVDLGSPRPLDYNRDFVLAGSVKGSFNDLTEKFDPRFAGLIAKSNADGTLGVLFSAAYAERRTVEEGYSPANVLNGIVDGGYCSPIGFAPQNPASDPVKGTNAANCATGVPRTSNAAAYTAVSSANAFMPRLPRPYRSAQDYSRLGLTGALQWRPSENTEFVLDVLHSKYDVERYDDALMAHSFGRGVGNNGKPHTSVVEAEVAPDGTVLFGRFNGVDVGSISTHDIFTTKFTQVTLNGRHRFNDRFEVSGLVGVSRTDFDEPLRFDLRIDANNVNNYTFDLRGHPTLPTIGYGFDITNPANFTFGPATADGTVNGTFGGRKVFTDFDNNLFKFDGVFTVFDGLKVRAGAEYREAEFTSVELGRAGPISAFVPTLPAGTTLASLTTQVTDFGKGLKGGLPSSWVKPDHAKFEQAFGLSSNTGNFLFTGAETGTSLGGNYSIDETVKTAFIQAEFEIDSLAVPVRGDVGVRYARTDQTSFGYVTLGVPVNGRTFQPVTVERDYDDWLPALNLTAELRDDLLLRFSAAKTIARPDLGQLSPSGGFNPTIRTVSVGNALLEPIRANTIDVSAEWYFARGALLSVGYFYKDIKTYIQAQQRLIPFTETGLPGELLAGTQATPADLFTVTNLTNTKGGPVKGVEVNYQQPLRFLPGLLSNTGVLFNYTYVDADIEYILNATTGSTTIQPLVGMSKNQANATLYYEDDVFSARVSANYRSKFVRSVPSIGTGSDIDTTKSTTYVDFSATYKLTEQFKLTFEGQNLTDEHTIHLVDSRRMDPLYDAHQGRTFTLGVSYRY
ncbi:TonB-dependent receptor [Caulobacter segnis]|uniref:TonB-dependent receptor n=1 Tax=Caulobacter segnis TaxID=88688 RepID=UPI00240F6330|nr:TonB-dependent receptor [Caulobacter segnis]MDG2520677.1 TonB-dependent receptor [Caulobacter segnis]